MRYRAVALDYDGTLATNGNVEGPTWAALRQIRASGRHIILVTGRRLTELFEVVSDLRPFSLVVAENGALIYDPSNEAVRTLAPSPPAELIACLRRRGVEPLHVGRVILATKRPLEAIIIETARELSIDLSVIFNNESVMVLPPGTDKGSGLTSALWALAVTAREVVGIGDAENDEAFLRLCGWSVAVANAHPTLRGRVDLVTTGERGEGVVEVAELLLASDVEDE